MFDFFEKKISWNKIRAVLSKEMGFYWNSPAVFISVGIFVVLMNWLFFSSFFLVNQVEMRSFFSNLPMVLLFFAPAVCMSSFAEEKRNKTVEIIYTLPLTNSQILLGKFFSVLIVFGVSLLLTLSVPLTLVFLGQPEIGPIVSGYLGSILLGSFFLSACLFVSSLSDNQIVSFLGGAFLCFVFWVIGLNFVLSLSGSFLGSVLRFLSVTTHFSNFSKGVLDLRDFVFFVSGSFVFLFMTVKLMRKS